MDENIAFCGMDCLSCPVYFATQNGDKNTLTRIAENGLGLISSLIQKISIVLAVLKMETILIGVICVQLENVVWERKLKIVLIVFIILVKI